MTQSSEVAEANELQRLGRVHALATVTSLLGWPFELLKQNCGHLTGVQLINAAVWSHDGATQFVAKGGEMGHLAACSATADPALVETVPCVRLRSYLDEHVDLLKMDIEGAECEVLRDCADQLGQVDRIFCEYHSFVRKDQLLARTIAVLETAGFRVHAHDALPSPRPFEELVVFNEKDLRLELFAYRDSVKPRLRIL